VPLYKVCKHLNSFLMLNKDKVTFVENTPLN
jgi:hypothetical protein